MNQIVHKGNWFAVRHELKQEYPYLTDDDLSFKEGYEKDMLENIQHKTGKSYEEMNRYLKKVSSLSQLQLLFN